MYCVTFHVKFELLDICILMWLVCNFTSLSAMKANYAAEIGISLKTVTTYHSPLLATRCHEVRDVKLLILDLGSSIYLKGLCSCKELMQ